MIISLHEDANCDDFLSLIKSSDTIIRSKVEDSPKTFIDMAPLSFEKELYNSFREAASGTDFDGSIELIGGQRFPDIVIKNKYGVEVKTTKQDKWTSTGNSIFESTRVENIEKIYIYFAKLAGDIDFKFRKYQDCLSNIGVTHSPRYFINMETPANESIFHKMNTDYETLRHLENPVEPFKNYLRKHLKAGEEPWWFGESDNLLNPTVKLFSDLTDNEKEKIIIEAIILFPEIFSKSNNKYKRLPAWLVVNHGVVSHNIRDAFTAGGQGEATLDGTHYENIPKIFVRLADLFEKIALKITSIPEKKLLHYWDIDNVKHDTFFDKWIELIIQNSNSQLTNQDLRKFIIHLCGNKYQGQKPTYFKKLEEEHGLYS